VERNRLLELAPQYYICAICSYFGRPDNRVASTTTLWNQAGYSEGRAGGMKNSPLFWYTLNKLATDGFLDALTDDFGPTIYTRKDEFAAKWAELRKQPGTVYFKWDIDPAGPTWLANALDAVNKALGEQKIVQEDFQKPDAEWEPIPVDRGNPKLQAATEALQKTIEAVEQDNGYNATLPQEKSFVVDSLKEVEQKLQKSDEISFAYLKRKAIDALDILIRRFGTASVGLAASAARAAIFDWIKEAGGKFLHWLFF
jgi:hypothetical protein